MATSDVFNGVFRIYFDSNILIYLVEGDTALRGSVLNVMRQLETRRIEMVTSELSLTECLNGAYRAHSEDLINRYLDLLTSKDSINMFPIDRNICILAAQLGASNRLKTQDSLHLASAVSKSCDAFLTNDKDFKTTSVLRVMQLAGLNR